MLDYVSALERDALLATDHGEAADARAMHFLRGLLGEGERVGKETLRPQIDGKPDGFYSLSADVI